jgi:type II secretion system protein H
MRHIMNKKGFALIELMVVIVIIGLLLAIVTLNFSDWQRKTQIEKQTRELYTDINTARTEAIFRKKIHRITFQPGSYVFKRYSTENEPYTAGTVLLTKNFVNQLALENGGSIADRSLEFNMRGMTTGANVSSSNFTLRVNPVGTSAMVDCVIIHVARTNMGKMENGSCISK